MDFDWNTDILDFFYSWCEEDSYTDPQVSFFDLDLSKYERLWKTKGYQLMLYEKLHNNGDYEKFVSYVHHQIRRAKGGER